MPRFAATPRASDHLPTVSVRLIYCDDDRAELVLLRDRLADDRRFEFIGSAVDESSATALIRDLKPDVVVIDLVAGPTNAGYLRRGRDTAPNARLIVYSQYRRWQLAPRMLQPADAFVTKAERSSPTTQRGGGRRGRDAQKWATCRRPLS